MQAKMLAECERCPLTAFMRGDIKKCKVLIIEDDKLSSLVFKETLKDYGLSDVQTAHTSIDAVSLLASKEFDFVFMDYHLEENGLDGVELISLIRHKQSNIIFIEGISSEEGNNKKMVVAGANRYIDKNAAIIGECLENCLKKGKS